MKITNIHQENNIFMVVKYPSNILESLFRSRKIEVYKITKDELNLMTCKNCIFWEEPKYHKLGTCQSDKVANNPNYYTEHDKTYEPNMVEVTYGLNTGPDFGCVHFKEKSK